MKRLLLPFFALFLMIPSASAQTMAPKWEYVESFPDAPGGRYDDMVFLDAQRGWIVNLAGEIWNTSDGAQTWNLQTDKKVRFRSVAFRKEDGPLGEVGWAGTVSTPESVLWETRFVPSDYGLIGEIWVDISHRIYGDKPSGICGIWTVGDYAWGVGAFNGTPTIIKTSDGGKTWHGRAVGNVAGALIDVYFQDENIGFAVGGTGDNLDGLAVILRTEDGGETWEQAFVSTLTPGANSEWAWKISFPSRDVGYVSVEYSSSASPMAKVLKTEDGGLSWREIMIPGSTQSAGLQGIGFISESTGWASGRGTTSITTDGGESWQQISHYNPLSKEGQLDGSMNRFFVVNDTLAFGVGKRLYTLSGLEPVVTVTEPPEVPESFTMDPPFPNPFTETTTLRYRLDEPSSVGVQIIDILGRIQRIFPAEFKQPGDYELKWDGRDDSGVRLPSGNYILLIDIGESIETKKVVFLN